MCSVLPTTIENPMTMRMKNMNYFAFLLLLCFNYLYKSNAKNDTSVCLSGTSILNSLIQQENYDITVRPCTNGEPVVVSVALYIVAINNIQESDMEFDIQIYFRQSWRDDRLKFAGLDVNGEDYIELSPEDFRGKVWMPDPYFENENSGRRHDIMKRNEFARLHSDGTILFSARLTFTLTCPMNFRNFPMDKQVCEIRILSYSYTTKHLIYKWLTNQTETSVYKNELTLPQFDIVKIEIQTRTDEYTVGNFTILTVKINLHRRIAFYLTHNYIPALLVTTISWLSFWIDRKSAPARVSIGITTILAMTTLMIGVGQQDLPAVSYIKAIDWYYIGCFVFVFSSLCEYAVVNYFDVKYRRHVEELRKKYKTASLAKAKDVKKMKECDNKYGAMYGMDLDNEPQGPSNDDENDEYDYLTLGEFSLQCPLSDAIDNAVTKIYPLLFVVFNIGYWTTYYSSVSHQHGEV